MTRKNDWPALLANYLLNTRKKPFQWGENDCCLFAANAIIAMGGDDVASDVRGRYKTATGAARVLKRLGVRDMVELLSQRLGEPDGKICRGSIVVVDCNGDQVVGIYYDKPWALTETGLTALPTSSIIQSWSLN